MLALNHIDATPTNKLFYLFGIAGCRDLLVCSKACHPLFLGDSVAAGLEVLDFRRREARDGDRLDAKIEYAPAYAVRR